MRHGNAEAILTFTVQEAPPKPFKDSFPFLTALLGKVPLPPSPNPTYWKNYLIWDRITRKLRSFTKTNRLGHPLHCVFILWRHRMVILTLAKFGWKWLMVSALKHLQNYLQICFPHPDFFRTCVLKILSSLKSQMTRRRLRRGWAQDGRRVQCSLSQELRKFFFH